MIPIEVQGITYTYPSGVTALYDITLTIAPGESVALLGQNGAGKTTLARHLNGLLQPVTGTVMIGDWSTRDHTVAQLARRVGYVFQHPEHQIFKRTVREEVAFGPRNLGYDEAETTELIAEALAATNLTDFADRHPHDLLPSQRKAVAIASVLAMSTPIVVFDEPTTGQDADGIHMIGVLIERLLSEGRTVVMITHDIDFCSDYARRCIVLDEGRVLLDGSQEEVWANAARLRESAVEPPQLARLAERLGLPVVWQTEPFLQALNGARTATDQGS